MMENEGNFWVYIDELRHKGVKLPDLPSREAWDAAKDGSPLVMRGGRVSFRSMKADTLFRLTLEPLQLQPTSNRFFRQFGSCRFLRLLFPALEKPPQYLDATRADLLDRVQEWLRTPDKELLGYKWYIFVFFLLSLLLMFILFLISKILGVSFILVEEGQENPSSNQAKMKR